ncbi:MAG: F0F1 ATP synthase subunit delta [Nitrospira sp.]|nr:F0F1 ATP synthase subunit delta [Nitrospira sp.]
MGLDWTTFLLEIVNFLALLWILKRFLYQPVLATLAERKARVARTLKEASEKETRATTLQNQFESRLADWEQEKAAARTAFDAEMATERGRQLDLLSHDLAAERDRGAAVEAHARETLRRELAAQANKQARQFASALLTRLACPEVEARLVDVFIEELASLPDARLATLKAAHNGHGQAVVTSAYPLSDEQRGRIASTLGARLELPGGVEFGIDASLLAGLRISLGAWQLDCSLAGELGIFAEAASFAN